MELIIQPWDKQLGELIKTNLESDEYTDFTFISAYAKNSGVLRLINSLEVFKKNNGKIVAFIGIDQKNTSYEALQNLFKICDQLYIIHSENISTTFHPKVYSFKNEQNALVFVGSNNCTAGGLWENHEISSKFKYDLTLEKHKITYEQLENSFNKYSDLNYNCSLYIDSLNKLDELLENGYILKESELALAKNNVNNFGVKSDKSSLFGSEKFKAPSINNIDDKYKTITNPVVEQTNVDNKEVIEKDLENTTRHSKNISQEFFWYEIRKSTGGSRNILDLSMLGTLAGGSLDNTKYKYKDPSKALGGIYFFLDNPIQSNATDIIITYDGHTYSPSTLLFAENNGSWRLQLKGGANTTSKHLSEYGISDFVDNILVFEKISSHEYILHIIDGSNINNVLNSSTFYAYNGNNRGSKLYGLLKVHPSKI